MEWLKQLWCSILSKFDTCIGHPLYLFSFRNLLNPCLYVFLASIWSHYKFLCDLSKCRILKFLIYWYYTHSHVFSCWTCWLFMMWSCHLIVFLNVDISIIDHIFNIFNNVEVQKGLDALQWLDSCPEALMVELLCWLMIWFRLF